MATQTLRRVAIYAIQLIEGNEGKVIFVKYAKEFEDNDLPPLQTGWIYRLCYEDVCQEDIEV